MRPTIYYLNTPLLLSLPKHCGISALHKPRELHSVLTVPFSRKPFSQVAVHTDPKVKGPFGSEQDRKPRESSIGLHCFTLRNRKAREGLVISKLHQCHCWPDIIKIKDTTRTEQCSDCLLCSCTLADRKPRTPLAL